MQVPVIFELDDNDEANGTIWFFCSIACRIAGSDLVPMFYTTGVSEPSANDYVCQHCQKPLSLAKGGA